MADRDAEIEALKHKAQGLHRVADKLAVTVEGLEAELADMVMKREASKKRTSDLEAKHAHTVNSLKIEFTGQIAKLGKMLGQAEDNLEDLRHTLVKALANANRTQSELEGLRVEHDKCPAVIAGLRKQIKDTKDALEMDDDMLEGSGADVEAGSMETETELHVRVKPGAPASAQRGRRVKLGAGMTTGGLPLPVLGASGEDAGAAEAQMHQACTLSGIARLRKELADTRMAHEQRGAAVAAKDAEIEELKADVVRLDKNLAQELDGRQALTEQMAKLEGMLARTEQQLEDHRQGLAESMAGKEAEMATMRMHLAEADQRQASMSGESWVCARRDCHDWRAVEGAWERGRE